MPLFGNKKSVVSEGTSSETAPTPPQNLTAEQIAQVVAQTVANLPQFQQPPVVATTGETDEEPPDPKEEARTRKIIREEMQSSMLPYAQAFDSAVPSTVRNEVVATLTPGQKMIYDKYKNEVDTLINQNATSPAARANPVVHRKAISMVLGDHSDEIETLSLQNATAEDVPHLGIPTPATTTVTQGPQLSETEKQFVDVYASATRRGESWTPESWDYYKNIPAGYLPQMIAEHKRRKAAAANKES